MRARNRRGLHIILFILFIFVFFSNSLWKAIFPIQYVEEVKNASTYFEVDPFLVLAVVQIESKFKHGLYSRKGATGLMQLMPETARWANEESGLKQHPQSYISDPNQNILLGTWYLSFLMHKYHGDYIKAIAAYNAGQGTVDKWIKEGIWSGTKSDIHKIPYIETRHYIKRVLYFYQRYEEIYSDEFN